MKNEALLLIDIQNDFLPGGSLAVPEGDAIIPLVNTLIPRFSLVVATQDWHPKDHLSFASQHPGKKVFDVIDLEGMEQTLWPDHCVQGTQGATFAPSLDMDPVEAIFRKGMDPGIDSYSGFYDNGHLKSTGLSGYLREKRIDTLHFCGLALDFCVYFSMVDALDEGFRVVLHKEATRAIDPQRAQIQLKKLRTNPDFKIR